MGTWGSLPSLLPPLAADAGIILLLRNPPHWWKVRLASPQILLCRAEKDAVFWWRASRRVSSSMGGKWRFGALHGCL